MEILTCYRIYVADQISIAPGQIITIKIILSASNKKLFRSGVRVPFVIGLLRIDLAGCHVNWNPKKS